MYGTKQSSVSGIIFVLGDKVMKDYDIAWYMISLGEVALSATAALERLVHTEERKSWGYHEIRKCMCTMDDFLHDVHSMAFVGVYKDRDEAIQSSEPSTEAKAASQNVTLCVWGR